MSLKTLRQPETPDGADLIGSAVRTLATEHDGLLALKKALEDGLGTGFLAALETIRSAPGRIIVTGMGKSGHVGQKLAATLASTGTPAFFVHPSEASHGDLGMITAQDVVIALSWSGETAELRNVVDFSRRFKVPMIAVTSNAESSLARAADVALVLPKADEACPHGLAPTTSTVMQIALGDAMAIALLESRGFTAYDFKQFHPGGQLGANLQYVGDIMHGGEAMPLAGPETPMSDAIVIMTEKSLGCLGIVDGEGRLLGVITDGDLRRHMGSDLMTRNASAVMTPTPKTVSPDTMVSQALELLHSATITALFVVEDGRPVGVVHIHDLLRAGVA